MTNRITIIGQNSFLSQALQKQTPSNDWRYLSHKDALSETGWIDKTDTLINCAFHPDLRTGAYSPIKDIDFMLAGYIQNRPIHYIMLSSRAVYGDAPKDLILREDQPPAPMGNIFGVERGRQTFFGQMLSGSLDHGIMRFNIAPDAVRDFLYAGQWARYMAKIANAPKAGLYNIGAGFGITTEELANWIIEIYGEGHAEYTGRSYEGQFILDTAKAASAYNLEPYTKEQLKKDCETVIHESVT